VKKHRGRRRAKRKKAKKEERKKRSVSTVIVYSVLGIVAVAAAVLVGLAVIHRRPTLDIEEILACYREDGEYGALTIDYPLDGTVFPPEIISPAFRWRAGQAGEDTWIVAIEFEDGEGRLSFTSSQPEWTPSDEQWEAIKRRSSERPAKVTVLGVNRSAESPILSAARISISTSKDEVGAPIFYREVNLPFIDAVKDPSHIRWRFGTISSREQPPIVLENLPMCGNCHSFSAEGTVLGMDVDYANDKGSYVIDAVAREMTFDKSKIITWSDYKRGDGDLTFGLLSQVSPDGRYVVSTVKDRSVFVPKPGLAFSQLFFPIRGILAVYDRETKTYHALPGADDRRLVQSNPTWSPDGKYIVFARTKAHRADNIKDDDSVLLSEEDCREFLVGEKEFRFDLYRIPFNDGKGGQPEPLEGASNNGMSNYFAKYSPDGKWIVFCKARTFMLLQPDSELYIIPASGGEARRLRCNTPRMNSWHSWSPNGRWLVFSSKANSPYTQLFLTHIDQEGRSTPPVLLRQLTAPDRAANIPEFVNTSADAIERIREQFIDESSYVRAGHQFFQRGLNDAASRFYRKALEVNPNNEEVHNNLGIILLAAGRPEEAEPHFLKAIALKPDFARAYNNLGNAQKQQGKVPQAVASLREALRVDPSLCEAHLSLGVILLDAGKMDEGLEHLAETVRLQPDNPAANVYYGQGLHLKGLTRQAAAHYSRALELDGNSVTALVRLAAILATSDDSALRDGEAAVRLAKRACELSSYRDPEALDALGMAYAEVGRFSDAAASAATAAQVALKLGNKGLADRVRQRMRLYSQQVPLRYQDSRPL